jgi:hypothetical protein
MGVSNDGFPKYSGATLRPPSSVNSSFFFSKPGVNLNHRRADTRLRHVVLYTRCSIVSSSSARFLKSLSALREQQQPGCNSLIPTTVHNKRFHHCSTVYSKATAGKERILSPVRNVPLRDNYSQKTQDEDDACSSESYMFHTLG